MLNFCSFLLATFRGEAQVLLNFCSYFAVSSFSRFFLFLGCLLRRWREGGFAGRIPEESANLLLHVVSSPTEWGYGRNRWPTSNLATPQRTRNMLDPWKVCEAGPK